MKFTTKKYEVCRQCHNIKQPDDFEVLEVHPEQLMMENTCYTCGFVESNLFERIAIEIPKGKK